MQILKKITIWENVFLIIALWADIFICIYCIETNLHISLSLLSRGYLAGSIIIFFFIAALITWWFVQIVALPQWAWLLLLMSISSLTTVADGIFFTLFPLQRFWPYFAVTNLWASCSLRHSRFNCSQEFSKNFFTNQWVIVVVKRITVKVVAEITQIRLQKM